jgi:hypothetical protein
MSETDFHGLLRKVHIEPFARARQTNYVSDSGGECGLTRCAMVLAPTFKIVSLCKTWKPISNVPVSRDRFESTVILIHSG